MNADRKVKKKISHELDAILFMDQIARIGCNYGALSNMGTVWCYHPDFVTCGGFITETDEKGRVYVPFGSCKGCEHEVH